jgi:Serine aminopeptidase, S33
MRALVRPSTSPITSPLDLLAGLPELPAANTPTGGWIDRAFTWVGGAIDATVLAAIQVVVDRLLVAAPEDVARIRRSAAPFLAPEPAAEPVALPADTWAGGRPGASETYLGPLADGIRMSRRIEWRREDPMLVEHWLHSPASPRATVIAVHGFAMGNPWIDARALFAHDWFRLGLDVALYTLPHHGARASRESRFSGEGFASTDVSAMNRALDQAVAELAVLVETIRAESGRPVGLIGLSVGGTLAALLAARIPDLAFVVPIAPPVCLGDLAWRFFSRRRSQREIDDGSFTHTELRACFRLHSPLVYPLRVPRDRVLLVAGLGDQIVPPEHPQALWRHWGEPAIHWFSGSHLAPFGRRGVCDAITAHLGACGVL